MTGGAVRDVARKLKLRALRFLLRRALDVSSVDDFVNAVNAQLRAPFARDYLAQVGAAKLSENLYDLAAEDESFRKKLVQDAAERMFRQLYRPAIADAASREYLAAQGVDDMERHIYAMATELGLPHAYRQGFYSQEGEDLVVGRIFDRQQAGFYIDVGAHHPFRFSNTYLLYRRGWRGINIDAMPGAMSVFQQWRPRDINIECMVSSTPASYTYFQYEEPALNTISEEVVRRREIELPHYRLIGNVTLHARTLSDILNEQLPDGQTIDFLNVDVEGHDFDVLLSNDWDRFQPRVIAAELLATSLDEIEKTEVYRFLSKRGYRLFAKMFNSAIFQIS